MKSIWHLLWVINLVILVLLWIWVEIFDYVIALCFKKMVVTVLGQKVFELLPTDKAHVFTINSTEGWVRLIASIWAQLLSLLLNWFFFLRDSQQECCKLGFDNWWQFAVVALSMALTRSRLGYPLSVCASRAPLILTTFSSLSVTTSMLWSLNLVVRWLHLRVLTPHWVARYIHGLRTHSILIHRLFHRTIAALSVHVLRVTRSNSSFIIIC